MSDDDFTTDESDDDDYCFWSTTKQEMDQDRQTVDSDVADDGIEADANITMTNKEIAIKLFGETFAEFCKAAECETLVMFAPETAVPVTTAQAQNGDQPLDELPFTKFICITGERGDEYRVKLIISNCEYQFPFDIVDRLPCRTQIYDVCFDIAEKLYSISRDYTDKFLMFEKETMTFYLSYNHYVRMAIDVEV